MKNNAHRSGLRKATIVLALGTLLLGGCASTPSEHPTRAEYDRFEPVNRKVFTFNQALDKAVMRPIAAGYDQHVPQPVQRTVKNVFGNVYEPFTALNALLQGKPAQAGRSATRFLINSTVGLVGLIDLATPLGVTVREEDFGQTFAVWGLPQGQYLMLPFFGPSTLRDAGGRLVDWQLDPLNQLDEAPRYLSKGLELIDIRAGLLGADEALTMQLDPYIFLRESYLQTRGKEIRDGQAAQEIDEFEEALFQD